MIWIIICILAFAFTVVLYLENTRGKRFNEQVKTEIALVLRNASIVDHEPITKNDIKHLPHALQKFLINSLVIGKKPIQSVQLEQKGSLKIKDDQKWMPFNAVQYYTTNPPSFLWHAHVNLNNFFFLNCRDYYNDGKGHMLIKLNSLTNITDECGIGMDQSTLVRYLNEMIWFPTAYLNKNIEWEAIDDHTVNAMITESEMAISAQLHFNRNGELVHFESKRIRQVEGRFVKEKLSAYLSEYQVRHGFYIPLQIEALWHLSSGAFVNIRLNVENITYNIHLNDSQAYEPLKR
ncbi:MAG: hypothetical protein K8S27_05245 [Candidatus Omnitrophica bacterium]|nr:hypothetical protein [Candidatus Omnitrophota bacterium]